MVFVFYGLVYLVLGLLEAQPDMNNAMFALATVYGLAFFSLVAGYFWARWYSVGVGLYGVIVAAVGMWQIGAEPALVFVGGTHLLATVLLWGNTMSASYDGQMAWRERFHMDESAVQRLGRSVIRAGVSLPLVLIYAFAPKPDAIESIGAVAALALAAFGLRAVVRMRTWGVLALGAAGALLVSCAGLDLAAHRDALALEPALAGSLLLLAAVPFARPLLRALRAA